MNIVLLTQWFDPEPTLKGLQFAKELQKSGHTVSVITGFPNYPAGKIYDGYKLNFYKKEIIDGINIHRVWLYPSHDSSAIKRVFNYLSFCFSSLIYGLFFLNSTDVLYVYHPPMTVGFSASIISFFRRFDYVLDVQDLWPDTLKSTGMLGNPKILWIIDQVCNWVYKRSKKIVVLSPGFKKLLIERGVPENKLEVIYNWCDETALSQYKKIEKEADTSYFNNKFNILFAGNIGKAQGLETFLQAAKKIQIMNSKIQFVVLGHGIELEKHKKFVSENKITNVLFVPHVPMTQVGFILEKADVLIVHLKDDDLFKITVPSKTQAYMFSGKPILMAVEGDAAKLIENSESGLCIPSENVEAMISAVLEFSNMNQGDLFKMGQRAHQYYLENLSFSVGVKNFLRVFAELKY